jgi:hypothetical protein
MSSSGPQLGGVELGDHSPVSQLDHLTKLWIVGISIGLGVAVGGMGVSVGSLLGVGSEIAVAVGGTEVDVGSIVGIDVGTDVAAGDTGVGVDVGGNGVAVFTISANCFSSRASTVASISAVLTPQPTTRSINPAEKRISIFL